MATIPFGNIGEFDPDKEEWSQYATRLRYFFAANGIATEDTKKAMLLTVVGPATFKTLRSLVSPASVDDKTYKQLREELQKFYSPKPSEIVQRFKFYNSRCRQPTESVAAFVTELRALAKHCNYHADSQDSLLRDRLVCGINDTQMQRRLLSEETLSFDNAFKLTLAMETAGHGSMFPYTHIRILTAANVLRALRASRERSACSQQTSEKLSSNWKHALETRG